MGEIRAIFEKHTIPEEGDPELLMFDTDAIIADIEAYVAQKVLEGRHNELNRIVKAEDYVDTASNADHPYEFDVEAYCESRHEELNNNMEKP